VLLLIILTTHLPSMAVRFSAAAAAAAAASMWKKPVLRVVAVKIEALQY
jgi:hypothetical protein